MAWKDYKTLDVTKETAIRKELDKLHIQYETQKRKHEPVNKGGKADMFKKRYS